jgi:ribosomal protein S19E (S16A)
METVAEIKLSPSEKWTLQKVAEGEFHVSELDWVALQHLKKHGFVEDRPAGVGITNEGRRVLRRLMALV